MLLTEEEACEFNAVPGITAIVCTYNSNPRIFALSLLSLLRCTPNLEHVIIVINGPDDRQEDPSIQDVKQSFLEAIRKEQYQGRNMPLTIMRVWSRIGHSQSIDAAIPFVHTQNYLLMHDDVLVMVDGWCDERVEQLLDEEKVGFIYSGRLLMSRRVSKNLNGDKVGIGFPHPNTAFLLAKKSRLNNFRWSGYYAHPPKDKFENLDLKRVAKYHEVSTHTPKDADFLAYDVGAYMLNHLKQTDMKLMQLPPRTIVHLTSFSWMNQRHKRKMIDKHMHALNESEIKTRETLKRLFDIYFDYFGDYPWDYA